MEPLSTVFKFTTYVEIFQMKSGTLTKVLKIESQLSERIFISIDNLFYYHQHFPVEQPVTGTSNNSCRTPDNWNGTCIGLRECRPLLRLLRKDLPTNVRTFLRNSQCEGDGTNIRVCCPDTLTINELPAPPQCGLEATDKIVGGLTTSIGEFPWYGFNKSMIKSISFIWINGNLQIMISCVISWTGWHCFTMKNVIELNLNNFVVFKNNTIFIYFFFVIFFWMSLRV